MAIASAARSIPLAGNGRLGGYVVAGLLGGGVEVVVGHGLFDTISTVLPSWSASARVTPSMVLKAFSTICSQPLHDIPVTEIVVRCMRGDIGSNEMTLSLSNQTFSSPILRP